MPDLDSIRRMLDAGDPIPPWIVRQLLHSADSMAWSYHARKNGRSANDWREAAQFAGRVDGTAPLGLLFQEL